MSTQTQKYPLDYNITKRSCLLMFLLFLPFNAIHEVGHLAVCYGTGHTGYLGISLMYSYAVCNANLDNSLVFRFAGGWLATIVALAPLTVKAVRSKAYFVVPLLSFAIAHFLNAIVETFAHEWYMGGRTEPTIVISMASFAIFIGLLVAFARNKKIEVSQDH